MTYRNLLHHIQHHHFLTLSFSHLNYHQLRRQLLLYLISTYSLTLRINCTTFTHNLTILVDGGSTHNIIQEQVVKFLSSPTASSPLFHVMIGNGESLSCNSICRNMPVVLANTQFSLQISLSVAQIYYQAYSGCTHLDQY